MNPSPTDIADDAINKGIINITDAYAHIYILQKQCEQAMAALKEAGAPQAFSQFPDGFVWNGLLFKYSKGRRNYKYDNLPSLVALEADLKAKQKLAQEAAIAGEKGRHVVDEEGTVVEPCRIEYSADTVVATPIK